jgi:antitoxin component YwqK of YwqJK toxin-antitoxin module
MALLACGTGAGGSTKGEKTDLSGYETTKSGGITKAIKMNDGMLVEEGYLKDGVKNGTWITYHPNKKIIKTLATYVDGNLHGTYLEFSNRGQIETKISYNNNTYDGLYGTYKNGRPVKEMEYVNGELQGIMSEYDGRGNLQKETNFNKGQPHGDMLFYDESGDLMMQYKYENGNKLSGGIIEKEE